MKSITVTAIAVSIQDENKAWLRFEIFIQTTPAGMTTGDFALPFSLEKFPDRRNCC